MAKLQNHQDMAIQFSPKIGQGNQSAINISLEELEKSTARVGKSVNMTAN